MNKSRFHHRQTCIDTAVTNPSSSINSLTSPFDPTHFAKWHLIPRGIGDGYSLSPFGGSGEGHVISETQTTSSPSGEPSSSVPLRLGDECRTKIAPIGAHVDQRPPVLLVSMDQKASRYLGGIVTQAGYHVIEVTSADETLRVLHLLGRFDLVLIHSVPDMQRSELCRQVRVQLGKGPATSVLVVSEQFDADEAVESLMSGASDYISGPHLTNERVLLARLHVALRSYHLPGMSEHENAAATLHVGGIIINPTTHLVSIELDGEDLQLTPIQFKILYRLARRPGRVFLHEEIRQTISEFGGSPDDRTVKSHVSHLRKRLGAAGELIKTVRGVGYKFEK